MPSEGGRIERGSMDGQFARSAAAAGKVNYCNNLAPEYIHQGDVVVAEVQGVKSAHRDFFSKLT